MHLSPQQLGGLKGGAASLRKMLRTGFTFSGSALWSAAEIEILRRDYPNYRKLAASLPGRTLHAIEMKAQRLQIVWKRRVWSDPEFATMARAYRKGAHMSEILGMVEGKTALQVYSKASRTKVRRPEARLRVTGVPLLDQVRCRARELNLSMEDLDNETGGGDYFRRSRSERLDLISRALKALGGRAVVRFQQPAR